MKDGDLLLVDAGAEYASYASDITRTWPVSGVYSKEQRALYELVLPRRRRRWRRRGLANTGSPATMPRWKCSPKACCRSACSRAR